MEAVAINNIKELEAIFKTLVGEGREFEICLRKANGTYEPFHKYILQSLKDDDKKDAFKEITKGLVKELKMASSNTDKLMHLQNISLGIQGLSMFIGIANLCVTAAGFAIMYKKLNSLSGEINEVLNKMKQIQGSKLNYEFGKVLSEYMDMLDHKKTKVTYSEEKYRKLIDQEYNVLKLLYENIMMDNTVDINNQMYAIMSLSNMLSVTICEFDKVYYFAHRDVTSKDERWHISHDTWMDLYKDLSSKKFLSKLQDFAFLDENLSQYQTDLFVASLKDSFAKSKQNVKDQQVLIKYLDSLQQYEKTQDLINQYLVNQIAINSHKMKNLLSEKEQEELETTIKSAENKMGLLAKATA